jgi:hypothetical protein
MGVGWQGGVILADPHHDAPDHARDSHQDGGAEAQDRSFHFDPHESGFVVSVLREPLAGQVDFKRKIRPA